MKIEILKKDGTKDSVSVDGIKLHSSYAPEKEAQRFVEQIDCPFNPSFVLVTEPALSYCVPFLKERFKNAKLCCIRYDKFFSPWDKLWDKSFYVETENQSSLSQEIYNYMGEEGISSCVFCSWKPSEKVFKMQSEVAWSEIKNSVVKSRTVLSTMTYFAKRWTKNALRFCLFSKKNAYIQKGSCPVIVCASGPSLKTSIPKIKKLRQNFFLIAVSSAVKPLVEQNIIPDMILSTDGGYWAKQHLSFAMKNDFEIPVALPLEAACYGDIYNQTIIPLSYGDGCGEALLDECGYTRTKAYRNGTVSGTAAKLALDITSGDVFFCGLDLAPAKGFCHTQPNELEETNSQKDFRLSTMECRLVPGTFDSPSLNTYRDWFSFNDFGGRLFRLSDGYGFTNKLGLTPDVDWDFFEKNCKIKSPKPNFVFKNQNFEIEKRKDFLKFLVKKYESNSEWIKNICPSEYIILKRSEGTENEKDAQLKIKENMASFCKNLMEYLDREN